MQAKLLYVKEDMKDVNHTVYLKKDVPYAIENDGVVEAENSMKFPLHGIWVDFRVVHRIAR